MAEKDKLTEQIKFSTEMLRLTWLSLLAVGSGTVGLLLGELEARRFYFAAVGIGVMVLFAVFIAHLARRIKSNIKQLTEV